MRRYRPPRPVAARVPLWMAASHAIVTGLSLPAKGLIPLCKSFPVQGQKPRSYPDEKEVGSSTRTHLRTHYTISTAVKDSLVLSVVGESATCMYI